MKPNGKVLEMIAQRVPGMLVVLAAAIGVSYMTSSSIQDLAHQVRANSFVSMMGMCGSEDQECRERILKTFEEWIELQSRVCN